MKSATQIAEQYEKLRRYYIAKCWCEWDYTGQGEKMLGIIEEIKERYLSNIINHFGSRKHYDIYAMIDRGVYMKKVAE